VRGAGEAGHLQPALGQQHLRAAPADARDRGHWGDQLIQRGQLRLDPLIELADLVVQEVKVRQDVGDQQPVVLAAEPARLCLGQLRLAVAQPALRQPRQHLRVVLPAGQRRHDRPSGLGLQH
jgi:hypothetical protein